MNFAKIKGTISSVCPHQKKSLRRVSWHQMSLYDAHTHTVHTHTTPKNPADLDFYRNMLGQDAARFFIAHGIQCHYMIHTHILYIRTTHLKTQPFWIFIATCWSKMRSDFLSLSLNFYHVEITQGNRMIWTVRFNIIYHDTRGDFTAWKSCIVWTGFYTSRASEDWTPSHFFFFFFFFFGCFLLLLSPEGVHATVFTKPAVSLDLFDIQTSTGACWKDNELQNTCTFSEFDRWYYKCVQREWAPVLGQPLYICTCDILRTIVGNCGKLIKNFEGNNEKSFPKLWKNVGKLWSP